jgi:hypothetical protein
MPYAVIRVAKIKTQAHALSATGHNYRQEQHPHSIGNADKEAPHPNREYINHEKKDYWSLLEARIKQAGVKRIRHDSVRGMEVILTGSPEAFKRDKSGRALDYSKSKWAQDNLNFLQNKFGAKNIVSFTLHQDEKTPHIHAVLAPITDKNTLSADKLFNPQSLRELQTDYAVAMAEYGMERGVEHSQAKHDPMQRLYGLEAQHAQRMTEILKPIPPAPPFQLSDPPAVPWKHKDWKADEEARINAELARQNEATRARLAEVAKLVQVNTNATEQVRALQKQLSTSEGLKQANYDQLQTMQTAYKTQLTRTVRLAVRSVQGDIMNNAEREMVMKLREQTRQRIELTASEVLTSTVSQREFAPAMLARGFQYGGPGGRAEFLDVNTLVRISSADVNPNGLNLLDQLHAKPIDPPSPNPISDLAPKKVPPKPRLKR